MGHWFCIGLHQLKEGGGGRTHHYNMKQVNKESVPISPPSPSSSTVVDNKGDNEYESDVSQDEEDGDDSTEDEG